MLPRLSLLCVPCVVLWAAAVPVRAANQPFLERYALAPDRAEVLKDLVPGTEDYYFYHVLYHQTQGRAEQAAAFLAQWETKTPGDNGRREILKNRAALLTYDKDPARTLAWLKEKLELSFDHQRRTEEARAELPSVLDPALISFAEFEKRAITGTEALDNVTETGLQRLTQPVEKWKLSEIRALLKRLQRPDFPKLVEIIDRELKEKNAEFGSFPIHTLLTSAQLAELQKRRPALLNNEAFVSAVMKRLRPQEFEDPARDPAVRGAWLSRLWAFAATLPAKANPLRANLLYHILEHEEKQGRLDPERLIAYLKLPRPVPYVNPRYQEDRDIWKYPAPLDFDPSDYTGTRPIGNDEALVRRLVIRYLTTAENADAIAPLVNDVWLRGVLAEARLLAGAPEPQRWVSLLPAAAYQKLRDRTDIEFDPASREHWSPDDVVTLDVWLKNVPALLVRVYEINTANVHRTGQEVNTGLDLDGLTANRELKFEYQEAPILRKRQTFSFPELNGQRGVWIIELIGNGRASRALIRKGGLRPIVRQTSRGTAVTVLDEKLRPVPKAFAMVGPKQFTADDKGLIRLPLSTEPGPHEVILDDGTGFTALESIELQGEAYELSAGFHVPRESLLPGNKATVLVQPFLQSSGRTVLLSALKNVKLTIASDTLDGNPATVVHPFEKVAADQELTAEFAVPERLRSLAFHLTADVTSELTGATVQVSASDSLKVNTLTTSGSVSDLHLSRNAGAWMLQELGLNGEARGGREVKVSFHRAEFSTEIEVLMKTDATGSIALGALTGILAVSAVPGDGPRREFVLPRDLNALPDEIHLKAGAPLVVPWPEEKLPDATEVSLIERRGEDNARLVPLPEKLTSGYLVWKNLPAGVYSLVVLSVDKTVRVHPGEIIGGHVLTPATTLQLTANHPVTVTGFEAGDLKQADGKSEPALVFHIGNATEATRVHIFTSRFLPEFDAMQALGGVDGGQPALTGAGGQPSMYLSARNIGDEYRYVLERRGAVRFAGNMLTRPGLLISPWEIAETKMEKEVLEEREKARDSERLAIPEAATMAMGRTWKAAPASPAPADPFAAPDPAILPEQAPETDLSFLATAAPALLNLRPGVDGNITVPRAALGDRPYVRVLAIDSDSSAVRDFSLPAAARPPRDQRLARHLDPAQHYSRQNRVTILEKDVPFFFDQALAAQFQAIGHLGAVQQLFFNLTQNQLLNEFSWLLQWRTFDDEKKNSLYSRYACHELHFFLYRKDRKYFDAVVKPFLASKRERTFMDDYLLEADLSRYLQTWQYGRLNALERILLAERVQNEQATARRLATDWINTQPVNRQRDQFLFETALRGRALIADLSEGDGKVADNRGYDWYFKNPNGRGDLLRRIEGSQFFLTTGSESPEMTVFGTPRTTMFPPGFVPWAGVPGALKNDSLNWEDKVEYMYTDLDRPERGIIVDTEYLKRQERVRGSGELEQEGDVLRAKQDYAGALERYRSALNTLPNNAANEANRARIVSKFGPASVIHARELGHRGEFEKAKNLLGETLSDNMSPQFRDAAVLFKQLDDTNRFNPAMTPTHYANTEEVKRLFNKGLGFYDLGQFKEAEVEFNRILAIDPYNTAARRQLERTQREVTDYLKSGRDETRLRMLNQVDSMWVAAVPNEGKTGKPGGGGQGGAALSFKLNNITIDRISFAEADLNDVLEHLKKKAAENDVVEADPARRGVSFINRVPAGQRKSVTLDLKNVKLLDAIKTVADQAGVRFDIQSNAVVMAPAGSLPGGLTTRAFRVPPDFLTRAKEDTAGGARLTAKPSAKTVLESLGVNFTDGTSAAFDRASGRLIVRGNPDQLDLTEAIVSQMNPVPNRGDSPVEGGEFDLSQMGTGLNGLMILNSDHDGDGFTDDEKFLGNNFGSMPVVGRLFRQQDPTKVWAEQQYYRLAPEAQTADLIPMNRFWRDYALWDGKGGFLSPNVTDAAGTFSEMVCALAVLDLPFPGEYKAGQVDTKADVLTLTPASRLLLFHQDILPSEVSDAGAKLLVSQNFYRDGDRYIEEAGEKTDKFVTAEFLTGAVYGCQVVVTNPSPSPQRVDVLFQIPAGSMPVRATRRVQTIPVNIEPWHTQTLEFHFYFPGAGKFPHFPVDISRDAKTAASALPFTFNVVPKPTINDPASWDYVSQHGTGNEVLTFLEQHNLYLLDLEQILWRLQDADFFRGVIAHLKSRHVFHRGVWSYAALHNLQPYLTEFVEGSGLNAACGPVFETALLTIDPVEQHTYQHLEYSPLINARAHPLGGAWRILNDKFGVQWDSLMTVLAFRAAPSQEDWLALAAYLATQDRLEEALEAFAKVNRAAVAEKLQYEYLRAWLAMCQGDTATARRIATALNDGGAPPPKHWLDKFAVLAAQLDELDGKPAAAGNLADRNAVQDALADKEPALDLAVEDKVVKVNYRNLNDITVRYYPVDLEFLFSANPFLTAGTAQFGNVRPAASEQHMLPANGEVFNLALPARFHSQAVLVEISSAGTTKAVPVFAHALDVQVSESFGQLTVQHGGKPLPKTYIKVFASVNGTPAFYKDGYTDLRGKFDYASLSTNDLNGTRLFSILIQSEAWGAVVKEVKPPVR